MLNFLHLSQIVLAVASLVPSILGTIAKYVRRKQIESITERRKSQTSEIEIYPFTNEPIDLDWIIKRFLRLPDYQRHFLVVEQCISAGVSVFLLSLFVTFVQAKMAPLSDARISLTTELPFCTKNSHDLLIPELLPWYPLGKAARSSCDIEVGHIVSDFQEGDRLLDSEFKAKLGLFTLLVVSSLLLLPHFAYWLTSKLRKRRVTKASSLGDTSTAPISTFVHRTQATTIVMLVAVPMVAWVVAHAGHTFAEAGDAIADVGATVISPLTFDAAQNMKALAEYLPAGGESSVVQSVVHIGSALHLIAASSAVVLLVLFEIFKETIIKPVLKTGVKEFQSQKYSEYIQEKLAAAPNKKASDYDAQPPTSRN